MRHKVSLSVWIHTAVVTRCRDSRSLLHVRKETLLVGTEDSQERVLQLIAQTISLIGTLSLEREKSRQAETYLPRLRKQMSNLVTGLARDFRRLAISKETLRAIETAMQLAAGPQDVKQNLLHETETAKSWQIRSYSQSEFLGTVSVPWWRLMRDLGNDIRLSRLLPLLFLSIFRLCSVHKMLSTPFVFFCWIYIVSYVLQIREVAFHNQLFIWQELFMLNLWAPAPHDLQRRPQDNNFP